METLLTFEEAALLGLEVCEQCGEFFKPSIYSIGLCKNCEIVKPVDFEMTRSGLALVEMAQFGEGIYQDDTDLPRSELEDAIRNWFCYCNEPLDECYDLLVAA